MPDLKTHRFVKAFDNQEGNNNAIGGPNVKVLSIAELVQGSLDDSSLELASWINNQITLGNINVGDGNGIYSGSDSLTQNTTVTGGSFTFTMNGTGLKRIGDTGTTYLDVNPTSTFLVAKNGDYRIQSTSAYMLIFNSAEALGLKVDEDQVYLGDYNDVNNAMVVHVDDPNQQVTVGEIGGTYILIDAGSDLITITDVPTYADDTAAGVGGLTGGQLYVTATGSLQLKL